MDDPREDLWRVQIEKFWKSAILSACIPGLAGLEERLAYIRGLEEGSAYIPGLVGLEERSACSCGE